MGDASYGGSDPGITSGVVTVFSTYYAFVATASVTLQCQPGNYFNNLAGACQPCPIGTYGNVTMAKTQSEDAWIAHLGITSCQKRVAMAPLPLPHQNARIGLYAV